MGEITHRALGGPIAWLSDALGLGIRAFVLAGRTPEEFDADIAAALAYAATLEPEGA